MVSGETVVQHWWGSEIPTKIRIGNHMINMKTNKIAQARRASAIWGL